MFVPAAKEFALPAVCADAGRMAAMITLIADEQYLVMLNNDKALTFSSSGFMHVAK